MSTKLAGLSSSYYFSCNARSGGKPRTNPAILPTIKRSKIIHQTRDLFNFSTNYKSRVISKPGKFQVKASDFPNNSSSSSWKNWLWGILLTVFLPTVGYKGGQLLYLKSKIDKAVERAEHVVEVVEEVAEEAEKMVEEMEKGLPTADSKLKKTLESIDNLAKKAVYKAKKAEEVVHKVKEMEEELEETLNKAAEHQPKK